MSDSLIPSMNLRFVERQEVCATAMSRIGGPPEVRVVRILQQMHYTPSHEPVWIDVPSVKESA